MSDDSDVTSVKWPDLSFYGLRLRQGRIADKDYVVCLGPVEEYDRQLDALGFRPHARQPVFVRANSPDRPLRVGAIRTAFPEMTIATVERSSLQLALRGDSNRPAASSDDTAAEVSDGPGIVRVEALLRASELWDALHASPESFYAPLGPRQDKGYVEAHAIGSGGEHEIVVGWTNTGDGHPQVEIVANSTATPGEYLFVDGTSDKYGPVTNAAAAQKWLDIFTSGLNLGNGRDAQHDTGDAPEAAPDEAAVAPTAPLPETSTQEHDSHDDSESAGPTDAGRDDAGGSAPTDNGRPAGDHEQGSRGAAGLDGEAAPDHGGLGAGEGDKPSLGPAPAADPDDDTEGAGKRNYRLKDAGILVPDINRYSPHRVVPTNLAAMRTLQGIEDGGRDGEAISQEDGDILIQYAGWGGAAELFEPGKTLHGLYNEFASLTSDGERTAASRSTLNAHYTSAAVVDTIWRAVEKMGFEGGVALEPGAGSGLFLAREPENVADDTRWITVEKDGISNRLLGVLYPDAEHLGAFEKAPIADDRCDLVVGNVPFGNYKVYDPPAYRKAGLSIHDQFIVKSLDKMRPGGVMAVITSAHTLDKFSDKARAMMHDRGDLLAAARLPDDAFKANAGATVTADILFFRKRLPGAEAQPFDWASHAEITGADGDTQRVNAIFQTPRGVFLGHPVRSMGRFGPQNAVVRRDPATGKAEDMATLLAKVDRLIPGDVLVSRAQAREAGWGGADVVEADSSADASMLDAFAADAEGCFVLVDDEHIGEVYNGTPRRLDFSSDKAERRVRGMLAVRNALLDVMRSQLSHASSDTPSFEDALPTLNTAYDQFVKKFGSLSANVNRRLFVDDPYADLLLASEDYDAAADVATKADVFRERTLPTDTLDRQYQVTTPDEALLVSLQRFGKVSETWMAHRLDRPWGEIREALGDRVFLDPELGSWTTAAKFLSGNVRRLAGVVEGAIAVEKDEHKRDEYTRSLKAVQDAIPEDVTQDEIQVTLGASWIEAAIVEAFVEHLYDRDNVATVAHNPATAEWRVRVPNHLTAPGWGTSRVPAAKIVETSLKGQAVKVMDRDHEGRYYVNETQTAAAMERQAAVEQEFRTWLWSDVDRAEDLARQYNDIFNSMRAPDYRSLPMDVEGRNPLLTFREEQASAITRIVMEPDTLLAHPVGYGKTATMGGAAMKLRQLGLSQKPMIVARKNTLRQTANEIVRWFPKSRPLCIESGDLNPKGRKAFWRRVQTRNPDIIVVTPEAFKRIPLSPEAEAAYLEKQIGEMRASLEQLGDDDGASNDRGFRRSQKQIEGKLADAESKMAELLNTEEKDTSNVTFEKLGIDSLFVDESQNYKNLQVHTRERLKGVSTASSQRAFDMASKVWSVRNRGGRVVFATGTPITNSLVEAYNIQRYLQPDALREMGIECFDAWKAQFASIKRALEPDPGGSGYREVARLAEVVNVPELVQSLALVTDAVDESHSHVKKPTPHFQVETTEPSPTQQLYRKVLAQRVQAIRSRGGQAEKGQDNILVVLGEARRAALDLKTMFPDLPSGVSGTKIAKLVDNLVDTWKASAADKGTQAVFMDLATPGRKDAWDGYSEIADRLVDAGVPGDEIAFVHDAKNDTAKAELFAKVQSGDVRIILGSTEKMGEGTNMQNRLVRLHHVNAPFHPGHMIQRNGRIVRQGNMNKDVTITSYVTRGLLEDWNWHLVTTKEAFIRQIFDGMAAHQEGKGLSRRITDDDEAAMDYNAIEAAASDNPLVKERCRLDGAVKQLEMERDGFNASRAGYRRKLKSLDYEQAAVGGSVTKLDHTLAALEPAGDTFAISVKGSAEPIEGHSKGGKAVLLLVDKIKNAMGRDYGMNAIARYRGLNVGIRRAMATSAGTAYMMHVYEDGQERDPISQCEISKDEVGMAKRIENAVVGLGNRRTKAASRLDDIERDKARISEQVDKEWPKEATLSDAQAEFARIGVELAKMNEAGDASDNSLSALDEFGMELSRYNADGVIRAHLELPALPPHEPATADDSPDNSSLPLAASMRR